MANTVLASAFLEVTVCFPNDAITLVTWMLARDGHRADTTGIPQKTTVWEVCDALAYLSGIDIKDVEEKIREASIDMDAVVVPDEDKSKIIEHLMEDGELNEYEDDEFLEEDEDDGGTVRRNRRTGEPEPEMITIELTANDRKLILKHGKPEGAFLALLDQNTRSKENIVVELNSEVFRLQLVLLTAAAVKMQGAKYDELADLVSYLLQEGEDQGLQLMK